MTKTHFKTATALTLLLAGAACFSARAEDDVPNPSSLSYVSKSTAKRIYQERGVVEYAPPAPVVAAAAPVDVKAPAPELTMPDLPPVVAELTRDIPALKSAVIDTTITASVEPRLEALPDAPPLAEILHDRPAIALPAAPPVAVPQIATKPEAGTPAASVEAEKLKAAIGALVASPAPRVSDRKRREVIAAFYAARNYEPVWVKASHWTPQAQAALNRLDKANEDGLNLAGKGLPSLSGGDFATAEAQMSDLVAQYIAQAMGSRVDPAEISKLITARPTAPDYAKLLGEIGTASDADQALQAVNPPQKGYIELRKKLAELRAETVVPVAHKPIPGGPLLKTGMKDVRVPLLRERFGLTAEVASDDIVYDTRIAAAVADFQNSSGLPASGTLTPRTIALLSGGQPSKLESDLLANMEVWRWVPRELGRDHIEVNIPDFTARLYRDEQLAYSTRVVVGKTDTPTPIFSNKMQFLIVNPYWNVPLSIINKEMLPKLAADPSYFTRHGYELVQSKGQFFVRQPPGDANALGRIKFMFPNEHSVYLHDTPSKSLFAQDRRAYSHGCVRVDQPFKFAEAVLGAGWSEQRIKSMIGGQERTVHLPEALPIHLTYFTNRVDDSGKLLLREDIYGYMRKVKAVMGLEG